MISVQQPKQHGEEKKMDELQFESDSRFISEDSTSHDIDCRSVFQEICVHLILIQS
jgi:hypothetical protein